MADERLLESVEDSGAEIDEMPEEEKIIRSPWPVLGLLIFAQAVLGTALNPIRHSPNVYGYFMLGIILSQPILFAMWAAFAPQRFYNRFLWALLLCAMVSFCIELGCFRSPTHQQGIILFADALLFVLTTPLLLLLRRFSGWQLEDARHPMADTNYLAYQFGIKHLFFLMITTAIVLSVSKTLIWIYPNIHLLPPIRFPNLVAESSFLFSCFVSSVVVSTCTLAYSRRLNRALWLILIILALVNSGCIFLIQTTNPHMTFAKLDWFLMFQWGVVLSSFLSALVIRACGFKLVWVKSLQSGLRPL